MIGNGQRVHIWKDRLIPTHSDFKVWSPIATLEEQAKVSILIDPDTKQWDRYIIYSCFNNVEAQQIISIPISHRLPGDKLIWHWEKDSHYSVRSANHILLEDKYKDVLGPSHSLHSAMWKEIWHAPLPNKIRNFLWRLAKDNIPNPSKFEQKGDSN